MTLPTDVFNETYYSLIPIECFLNRVFPPGFYDNEIEDIVHKRLFKPRKDCEPYQLVSPIDWEAQSIVQIGTGACNSRDGQCFIL